VISVGPLTVCDIRDSLARGHWDGYPETVLALSGGLPLLLPVAVGTGPLTDQRPGPGIAGVDVPTLVRRLTVSLTGEHVRVLESASLVPSNLDAEVAAAAADVAGRRARTAGHRPDPGARRLARTRPGRRPPNRPRRGAPRRTLDLPGHLARAEALVARLTTAVAADDPLSPREREVADLIVEGLTNHEIAGRLYLSERTVESHVRSALMKVGARNRAQLIRRETGA
jgi:DNA-binding CsgD family transcriptional regulator